MSWINFGLLPGLLIAVLPVILHLVMRARPKRIEFPALQLLLARQPSNARRMQLRHWILLLLRMLVLAVLVLAIARPSLPAARYGLRWWEWLLLAISAGTAWGAYRLLSARDSAVVDSIVQQERRQQRRRWCLLGGILAALLTVGLPWGMRVQAELAAPHNEASESVPVAAVFLVDTSVSMNYRHENLTRLEKSREVVTDHLSRLPAGSVVAVSGLDPDEEIVFQVEPASAAGRLESLTPTPVPEQWNRRLRDAIRFQVEDRERIREETGGTAGEDRFAREIYVVTDFSRTSWQVPDESGLRDAMTSAPWLQVYLVDVSVAQPGNLALSGLRLSDSSPVAGGTVELTVNAAASGRLPLAGAQVETILLDEVGRETRVGAPAPLSEADGAWQFVTSVRIPADKSYVEGLVRLVTEDSLPDDNVRYFSLGVKPRPKVLLIADQPTVAVYLRNALQPELSERQGVRTCDITVLSTAQAASVVFADFDVVAVINCQRPGESLWTGLRAFAASGRGVLVVAGSNRLDPGAWSTPAARDLLPAVPIRVSRFLSEPGQLAIAATEHPVTREFARDEALRVELASRAFDRCWAVEPAGDANVLLRFSDPARRPALLERAIGQGRCLLFTSAMDNLPDGGSLWNNLTVNWSFLVLADQLLQHLTGASTIQRSFTAGDVVELPVSASERFDQFLLRRPGLRQTRGTLTADSPALVIEDAVDPGHYRARAFESPSPFDSVFAVNLQDEESDLTKIEDGQLTEVLGPDRVTIVHQAADLQRAVKAGRLGVEVFPVLMGLLLLLFCGEHLLANFFYEEPAEPAAAGRHQTAIPAGR
jgi:hypothetical protein